MSRTHGRPSTYNRGCHCEDCTEANRHRCAELRAALRRRAAANDPAVPHGTTSGYKNWGCRCRACTDANNAQSLAYYYQVRRRTQETTSDS